MATHRDGRDEPIDPPRPSDGTDLPDRGWHPVVLDRLVADSPAGFDDLRSSLGIPERALVRTLDDLVDRGFVEREVTDDPARAEYTPALAADELDPGAGSVAHCDNCGCELLYARDCSYCGRQYCADHRLPENHGCPGVDHVAIWRKPFDCGPGTGTGAGEDST